jgi:hypothetical protein
VQVLISREGQEIDLVRSRVAYVAAPRSLVI